MVHKFLKNNWILITVFFVIFCISRIPFFLCPVVGFLGDTPDYYNVAFDMSKGELPLFDWLPPGYILVLYYTSLIFTKSISLIVVQNIFTLISYLFLLLTFSYYYPKFKYFCVFILSICLFNSSNLEYDTAIMTESIYTNLLVVLCALTIHIIKNNNILYTILTSIFLILPAIFRLNGIILFPILLLMIFFFAKTQKPKSHYFALFIPFSLIWFAWSSYNYSTQNIFFIGYPTEILKHFKASQTKPLTQSQIDSTNQFKENHPLKDIFNIPDDLDTIQGKMNQHKVSYPLGKTRTENYLYFFKQFNNKPPYYSYLKRRYKAMYVGKWPETKNPFWGFDDPSYVNYLFKDWKYPPESVKTQFLELHDNYIFKIYDYIYFKFYAPLTRNYIVIFMLIVTLVGGTIVSVRNRKFSPDFFIYITWFSVLFLSSIVFLSPSAGALMRYTYPTEFIYYISLLFIPIFFSSLRSYVKK